MARSRIQGSVPPPGMRYPQIVPRGNEISNAMLSKAAYTKPLCSFPCIHAIGDFCWESFVKLCSVVHDDLGAPVNHSFNKPGVQVLLFQVLVCLIQLRLSFPYG